MDMNYISDPGYQSSLINTIEDRMIFKSVCFDNPVFMGVQLVEAIKRIPGVAEVSYEGCTSNLFIRLSPSRTMKKLHESLIVNMCTAISCIISGDGIYENNYERYRDKLILAKLETSKALKVQDVYEWLMAYLQNPSNFLLFFKVFNNASDTFTINFG